MAMAEVNIMGIKQQRSSGARRATNVTISAQLLAVARELDVNISQAAEQGLERAIAERRAALWLEENRAALESSNAFVEQHGLPLAQYRNF
jgi:antitoxin CcdA